jgi:hypothetical protein
MIGFEFGAGDDAVVIGVHRRELLLDDADHLAAGDRPVGQCGGAL